MKHFIYEKASVLDGPIALLPVREMGKTESYYKPSGIRKGKNKDYRNSKPRILLPSSLPGSEAYIAIIAAELKRLYTKLFVSSPTIENIRKARCGAIFFIDDLIGSGKRMLDFLSAFERHLSIRSWHSSKLIKYYIISYAATDYGLDNLREFKPDLIIRYIKKCPTFDSLNWGHSTQINIEDICRRYAHDNMPLGFSETKGCLVFQHSVPNNTPSILWDNKKGLFPNRRVPLNLKKFFDAYKPLDYDKFFIENFLHEKKEKLKILLAILIEFKRSRNPEFISNQYGFSYSSVIEAINVCKALNYIDKNNNITKSGLEEIEFRLKVIRRKGHTPEPVKNETFYFPKVLRGIS